MLSLCVLLLCKSFLISMAPRKLGLQPDLPTSGFHVEHLMSSGGGWYGLANFYASTERRVHFGRTRTAHHQADTMMIEERGGSTTSDAPQDPTTALPSWGRWCLATPCDGSSPFYMATYAKDDVVSASICSSGSWEACDSRHFTKTHASSNSTQSKLAFDIGANIGYYTLLLANAGWNVVSVEPLPMNTELLEASLNQNPIMKDRVSLHKTGLAGEAGSSCIIVSEKTNLGDGNMYCSDKADEITQYVREAAVRNYDVRGKFTLTTLDDVLAGEVLLKNSTGIIDFLKIDVEGFEAEVMRGGSSLLAAHKPRVIQSELWAAVKNSEPAQYLTTFAKAGYAITPEGAPEKCATPTDVESIEGMCQDAFSQTNIATFRMCLASEQ